MEDHCPEYRNPHGVVIILQHMAIYVQAEHPQYEYEADISLNFIRWCNTPEEFFEIFEIKEFRDLGRINQSFVENLYLRGIAQLFCLVDEHELTFQKKENSMAISDERDHVHELNQILSRPEEFIDYTRQYYKKETAH